MRRSVVMLSLAVALSACQVNQDVDTRRAQVKINNNRLNVELAQTVDQQRLGLGQRDSLGVEEGMLFIFPRTIDRTFWMLDMRFPIDIIWIKDDLVIGIEHNAVVPTSTELLRYHSTGPVNFVLETNAGWAKKNNVKFGDRLEYSNIN